MLAIGSISKRERRLILTQYAFLAPQLILFLGLTIIPFFVAIPMLFTDQASFTDAQVNPVGLNNFTAIFRDASIQDEYLPALRRTVVFVAMNFVMIYLFGLSLALLLYEVGFHSSFFTVVYLPLMASGIALGSIAVMLFARGTGTLNLMAQALGVVKEPFDIYTPVGTGILLPLLAGWRWAGFNMAIFLSGLLTIPKETIEASIVDGASYWQRLIRVYFPQMWPSFILASTMCLIGSWSAFDELVAIGALYNNPEAKFLSIVFFTYGFQINRLSLGMTLALETFLPLTLVGIALQWLQRRLQYY